MDSNHIHVNKGHDKVKLIFRKKIG